MKRINPKLNIVKCNKADERHEKVSNSSENASNKAKIWTEMGRKGRC